MIILIDEGNTSIAMLFFLTNKILKILAKLSSKNKYEFSATMSDEDAVRNIGYLAHELRKVRRSGVGVPIYPLKLALSGCTKLVSKKRKEGRKIYDFEKWISDNSRLLLGTLANIDFKAFASLPHADGIPRIIVLADFIVKYSGGRVTKDRIRRVIDAFNAVTPLSFLEIKSLKDALAYRLLTEISFFAQRSLHYFDNYRRARSSRFHFRRKHSDSYLTYYEETHPNVSVDGIDPCEFRSAVLGFENILADNLLLTSCYITSLRNLTGELDEGSVVSLALTDHIYRKEESYRSMSDAARADYLIQTSKCADRNAVSEQTLARACLELASDLNVHFGEILYYYPSALAQYLRSGIAEPLRDEKTKVQGVYCFLVIFLSILIAAFPAYYLRTIWAYLSVIPIFIAVLHPVEYMLKRLYSLRLKSKPLPQMDYKVLPEECRTVVVISRYIGGEGDASDALMQAETLAAQESDPAVSYVILADLPSSEQEWGKEDDQILSFFRSQSRSDRISVFIRKRTFSGKKWRGYERKRGALLDCLSAIREGTFDAFIVIGATPSAEFAVLLDDDSEMLPGTIRSAILAMAHPLNREYDLMSFGGKVNRYSIKTHYALRYLRGCTVEAYPFYSDFYADAFDSALYCGKAIVRIRPYLDKLSDFFPDGRILSHDIIEGAVLHSTSLKRCVYEDAPSGFSADYRRTARWQRGDIQLLPYAMCNRVKNRLGNRVKNPIAPIYKLIIFINGMTVLREFMTLFVIAFSYLSGNVFLFGYAVSSYLFVKGYAMVLALRGFFSNIRFSHALRVFILSVELLAEDIFLLPFRAIGGAYLFIVTCVKMVLRSDLLGWTPFRATQMSGGVENGAKLLLPTVIFLSTLTILLGDLRITIYTSAFLLYSFSLLISGRPILKRSLGEKSKEKLRKYAIEIYRYFSESAGSGLIPDNLQLFPYRMKSSMTSPTNLGFALLAEICAYKLGLIEAQKAMDNINKQLDLIEKLEKYHGHLFNWYDISDYHVMPPRVVSTVDSANFLACLSVIEAFAREEGANETEKRAKTIIEKTDFMPLYDKSEKCLAIIKRTDENTLSGRYDLLASESRLAYYFAIGAGIDPECYFLLGRECTSIGGNTILSWSGTAFEYMLPRLFLRAPIGSLISVQEERSGDVQRHDISDGVFGRSECGYYAFNDATAFCYKAVGCADIALSGEHSDVIAPYASFLYLPCFPEHCINNLTKLAEHGAEGEYGFYEAIDYDHDGDIVRSYMTHHQGMSLTAITNALCDDEIVRLFSSLPRVRAVRLLLAEENITTRKTRYIPSAEVPKLRNRIVTSAPKAIPDTLAIRCGEYSATYDALGRSAAMLGEYRLTKALDYLPEYGGVFVEIKEGEHLTSPSYYPMGDESCYAIFEEGFVKYVNPSTHCRLEVSPLSGYQGELRKLVIENPCDIARSVTVSVYADMMLNTDDAYASHPAFSDMFVNAEFDEGSKTQYLYRKDLNCDRILAVSLMTRGLTDIKVNCNAYNVIGRCGENGRDYAVGVEQNSAPTLGDVLYPCFAVSGKTEIPPHGSASVYFCMLADRDPSILKERNSKLDLAYRSGAIELIGRSEAKVGEYLSLSLSLTGILLYGRTPQKALFARIKHREELSALGVDPSDDLLYFDCNEDRDREKLLEVARLIKLLRDNGMKNKLLVVCEDIAGAGMSGIEAIVRAVGVIDPMAIVLEKEHGARFRDCAKVVVSEPIRGGTDLPVNEDAILPELSACSRVTIECGEGGFTEGGYFVKPFGAHTLLPYVNVVGGRSGGFVITENGGGFTFGNNSREEKITLWTGDALRDYRSEELILKLNRKEYVLNANHCEHRVGSTVFTHLIDGVTVRVSVSIFKSGRAKIYEILFTDDLPQGSSLSLSLIPSLGWRFGEKIAVSQCEGGYVMTNLETMQRAYLSTSSEMPSFAISKCKSGRIVFSIPISAGKRVYRFIISSDHPEKIEEKTLSESRAKTLSKVTSNAVFVQTKDRFLDILNNHVLPYQSVSSRLNARTGLYQCGGAYGFRDQLQDTLGLLLSDPVRVREQILLSAAHQYAEGDVQHWWHPPKTGVRTRISDDRLWMVYLTERYLEVTEDYSILDKSVAFLSSPILAEWEVSRYEIPREGEVGTLREHLLRAIRITLQHGEHGLLRIGTGDWNDGLDRVGKQGRGESVWLTMFAYKVIDDALRYFSDKVRMELSKEMTRLRECVMPLFRDGRYPLAFCDDGSWLGYPDDACRIALNPQTWAVLSGIAEKDNARRAMDTAKALVDKEQGIVKLSSPPFDERSNYGYVSAYPYGMRENGGQYTHAAVWYLKALLELGEKDEAYRIISDLNPMNRCRTKEGTQRYRGEPYVLSGDVYASDQYLGRAGWSWYTGSAGWLKYVLTEDFFGIKKRGDRLYVSPCFPGSYDRLSAVLTFAGKKITIEYERGDAVGLYLNGEKIEYLDLVKVEENADLLCRFV